MALDDIATVFRAIPDRVENQAEIFRNKRHEPIIHRGGDIGETLAINVRGIDL